MQCFSHRDAQAIGVCKTCGKSICPSCVQETEGGIVCSQPCAREALLMREMNQRALKIYGIGTGQKGLPNSVIAPLLMGIGFLLGAALLWFMTSNILPMVLLFLMMAGVTLLGAFLAWRKFRENGINV